jgi:Phage-related lysozyme (muraminidase)
MKHSPVCTELVKRFEGFRSKAYLCPAGIRTVGYGHTLGVGANAFLSEPEAAAVLDADLELADIAVSRCVSAPLNQNQFDALASFAFNLGGSALRISTLLKKLNARDYAGAAAEFGRWTWAGGKLLNGPVARRAAERELFERGTSNHEA